MAESASNELLVALRPHAVTQLLAARVGRDSYFGSIFWPFCSTLVGQFHAERFVIAYRRRQNSMGGFPKLEASLRPTPEGAVIRYHVRSGIGLVALIGGGACVLLVLIVLGFLAGLQAQGGTVRVNGGTRHLQPGQLAGDTEVIQSVLGGAACGLVPLGAGLVATCLMLRSRTRALPAWLHEQLADAIVADVVPVDQAGVMVRSQ